MHHPRSDVLEKLVCLLYPLSHCAGTLLKVEEPHMEETGGPNNHKEGYPPTINIYNGFFTKIPVKSLRFGGLFVPVARVTCLRYSPSCILTFKCIEF